MRTRQYGAFLFPRFLSERLDAPLIVQETLLRSGSALQALDSVVADQGEDMARLFGDFAVANATWDYERQTSYRYAVSASDGYEVARAGSLGRRGWRAPPPERRPEAWGWDLVRIDEPASGVLQARFRSLAPCDVAAWVHVVSEGPDGVAVTPLVQGGRDGTLDLDVGGEDRVFLAMAFTGPPGDGSFSYQYAMQVDGEPVGAPPPPGWPDEVPNCEPPPPRIGIEGWEQACAHSGPVKGSLASLLLWPLLALRRRRARPATA